MSETHVVEVPDDIATVFEEVGIRVSPAAGEPKLVKVFEDEVIVQNLTQTGVENYHFDRMGDDTVVYSQSESLPVPNLMSVWVVEEVGFTVDNYPSVPDILRNLTGEHQEQALSAEDYAGIVHLLNKIRSSGVYSETGVDKFKSLNAAFSKLYFFHFLNRVSDGEYLDKAEEVLGRYYEGASGEVQHLTDFTPDVVTEIMDVIARLNTQYHDEFKEAVSEVPGDNNSFRWGP